jgi:hypothetical protein
MKRQYTKAFNALQKMGCPVYEHADDNGNFSISTEVATEEIWAEYYDGWAIPGWEFGINPKLTKVLDKSGLYAEWQNPGRLTVWEG